MTLTLTDALMPRGSYRDVFTEPQRADALLELVKAGWLSFMFQVDFPGQATSCVSLGLTASLPVTAKKGMWAECCGEAGSGRKMWRDVQKKDKKTQTSRTRGATS